MKILFKFPSRSRPKKFFAAVENILSHLEDHDNYLLSFTLDSNDHSMNDPAIIRRIEAYPNTEIQWGHSKSKVEAVNRNVNVIYPWEILVLCSDDMEFIQPGFDNLIRRDFEIEETLDRVIHYRDGYDHGNIISLPVLGRKWYTNYCCIYAPVYISLFCDEELYIVASKLGKLYSSDHSIVKHNHPAWCGGEIDAQLKSTQSFWGIDHETFKKRQRANFFIK